MRIIIAALLLSACGQANQAEEAPAPETAEVPAASAPAQPMQPMQPKPGQSSPLMAIPEDPEAVKKLEAMGYTIHQDQGHLHAPGVTTCPMMGNDPVV
jgi:hypothetical protein